MADFSLNFDYDYEYMAEEIVAQIKDNCNLNGVEEPNIFTEFGSFTVGESGATLFSVLNQKQQNDRERWYMIDSSFMTTLPDIWGIDQRYPLLAINPWDKEYQRVFLGGLTCDSEDGYAFSGYRYADWGQVAQECAASAHVIWSAEYVPAAPQVFAD